MFDSLHLLFFFCLFVYLKALGICDEVDPNGGVVGQDI